MRYFNALTVTALLLLPAPGYAQLNTASSPARPWTAQWIAAPNDAGTEYGVYYFRKDINLAGKPSSFVVHVSADNRYKLYVNGALVSLGPARGDTYYWNYETVDLAPYLKAGGNTVAALVWNEGRYRPEAQFTIRTAFIVQGDSPSEDVLNTNNSWKCVKDSGCQPLPNYFGATTDQLVDMNQVIMGWNKPDFDDSAWPAAANLSRGRPKGTSDGFGWELVPSPLPPREMRYQRLGVLRKASGMRVPSSFPAKKVPLTIPAHSRVVLLVDQTFETNAYVTLNFSGGKDAGISLGYGESLYDNIKKYGMRKGNRNDVEGKDFSGRTDSIISNGKTGQSFTSLYFRTYRYIRLAIQTREDPLVIDDLYGTFTGYPFKMNAVFDPGSAADSARLEKILRIGWRTARLNAWETYTDCPYYEQLQYIGDTRIEAMVSYYNSGDDRLARNAIDLLDHSRLAEGVTLSRYPTHDTQIIPTFSLWYIGMLHDYWMYRGDSNFIRSKLTGERAILHFFSRYQGADGSVAHLPYWTFVDWADGKGWNFGVPPVGEDGSSAIIDLQLLWAYQWAEAMEARLGLRDFAVLYHNKIRQLKQTIRRKYWDQARGLYADTEDKTLFSQHANSLALLTGMVKGAGMRALGEKLLHDTTLTQCSIYFKYYLNQALVKAGLGNDYLNWLGIWSDNMKMGLTTWAESSNLPYSRSDCHAWGSSPNIEFFRTVLGIDSDGPGFRKIKIEPHLGTLTSVSGEMPHPDGKIRVRYRLGKKRWKIAVDLPAHTSGILVWKGKSHGLKAGYNAFSL
jgi:hypothetical protein